MNNNFSELQRNKDKEYFLLTQYKNSIKIL